MIEFFLDWGLELDPKSSIKGYFENECLVIEYQNTLTPSDYPFHTIEYEGNKITVELKNGDIPDIFSVEPAYGWIVEKGPNPAHVEEHKTGTIVLCLVALS
jgi:hypothetical protein